MKVFLRWFVPISVVTLSVLYFYRGEIRERILPSGKRARWIREYLEAYQPDGTVKRLSQTECSKIIAEGRSLTTRGIKYDPSYRRMNFPGGDVAGDRGVCADVIVRALRPGNLDLQKEIYEDRMEAESAYPEIWHTNTVDTNIDHRRVPNIMTYLDRKHFTLPISSNERDYSPCDIVAWDLGGGVTHIGIVSEQKTIMGRPKLIHHIAGTPKEEDVLFRWKIIGHYALKSVLP